MPNTRRRTSTQPDQAVANALSIADLNEYLNQTTNRRTTKPLAESFAIPFATQLEQYQTAYGEGALGFDVDLTELVFAASALDTLREAIEHDLINGVLLLAYPTKDQLRGMNESLGHVAFHAAVPASVFLVEHLRQRGFSYFGITPSFGLRCSDRLRKELCRATKEQPGQGEADVLRSVYNQLSAPPSLERRLGYRRLAFTSIDRVAPWERRRATYVAASIDTNLAIRLSLTTPEQFLALHERSTPGRPETYLARDAGEWLAGLTPSSVTYARADIDGFGIYEGDAGDWITSNRLRPVLK